VRDDLPSGKKGKGKKGKPWKDGAAPAVVRLPDLARIWRDNGDLATVGAVEWVGSRHIEPDAARDLMQSWVDAGLAEWVTERETARLL
jgi:hypothetical protein